MHVEAECDRSQQVAETEWVTAMHAQYGMPNAIVAHAWVDTPNAEEIIAGQSRFPLVRGMRTKPVIADGPNGSVRGQPRSLQDPEVARGAWACWRNMACHGICACPGTIWKKPRRSAASIPRMRIVLNHTGYPLDRSAEAVAVWRRGMQALAACPNVWCKISGLHW